MKTDILNYIERVLKNLHRHLQNEEITSNEREKLKLELRIEVFNEIKNAFEWKTSSEEDRQGRRILAVAKSREQELDVTDQLKEINLYSKIKEVLPYLHATSYPINSEKRHLTQDMIEFCENQLKIIDSTSYKRKINFPIIDEVNVAFKNYLEFIKPDKIPALKVFRQPEAKQKIEELYQVFLLYASPI
jgi:hypothetical protein